MALFQETDDLLSPTAKQQLMSEVFFLTHSAELHAINMQWNPKGEEFLWSLENQAPKKSAPELVVYNYKMRQRELQNFTTLLQQYLPSCTVRYSF